MHTKDTYRHHREVTVRTSSGRTIRVFLSPKDRQRFDLSTTEDRFSILEEYVYPEKGTIVEWHV